MKVLAVLEAGDAYPSGFIRGLIYAECFKKHGFEVKFTSRLSPGLVRLFENPTLYAKCLSTLRLSGPLMRAATVSAEKRILEEAGRYDVIYLSKVISCDFLKRLRGSTRARLVLDFGDAVWLPRYDYPRLKEVLAVVDAVTTDNQLTADYVRRFNKSCTVIPDCPQVEWFDRERASRHRDNDAVTIGWIGTASTAYNLYVAWEALERLFARHDNIHLRLVGTGFDMSRIPSFERVRFSCLPRYTQAEMIREVLGMDIGIFPLQDVEASRVRGVLKATVYMAGEAAVVASAVGQCPELIRDGVNGMLALSVKEWEDKIELLVTDRQLRRELAKAGLETVRDNFTVESSFAKLAGVLEGKGRDTRLLNPHRTRER